MVISMTMTTMMMGDDDDSDDDDDDIYFEFVYFTGKI